MKGVLPGNEKSGSVIAGNYRQLPLPPVITGNMDESYDGGGTQTEMSSPRPTTVSPYGRTPPEETSSGASSLTSRLALAARA